MKKNIVKISLFIGFVVAFLAGCRKDNEVKTEDTKFTINGKDKSVIGGQQTDIVNMPYQCAIFRDGGFSAGGVILSPNWILTAAHVVTDANGQVAANRLTVGTGASNIFNSTITGVDQVIRNPNYSGTSNDIALVHLTTPLTFNANTSAIVYETGPTLTAVNDLAIVSGWGAIAYNSSTQATTGTNDLFAVDVKVSSIDPAIIYTSSTSGSQQAPCFGDSGGPLTVGIYGNRVLVGVVNGWGDCNIGAKGYARVAAFADWILAQTGISGLPSITATVKNNSSSGFIPGAIVFKRGSSTIASGSLAGAQNSSQVTLKANTYTLNLAWAPPGGSALVEVNGAQPVVVTSNGGDAVIGNYFVGQGFQVNVYSPYYANTAMSTTFTRNNCTGGQIGTQVTYSVPAGKYYSGISQADANSKAQAEINSSGQAYANTNGSCVLPGSVQVSNSYSGMVVLEFRQNGTYIKSIIAQNGANITDTSFGPGAYDVKVLTPGSSNPVKITLNNSTSQTGTNLTFGINIGSSNTTIAISNP